MRPYNATFASVGSIFLFSELTSWKFLDSRFSEKDFYLGWIILPPVRWMNFANPVRLGGKRKRYLSAMVPPFNDSFLRKRWTTLVQETFWPDFVLPAASWRWTLGRRRRRSPATRLWRGRWRSLESWKGNAAIKVGQSRDPCSLFEASDVDHWIVFH